MSVQAAAVTLAMSLVLLAGCGDKKSAGASQTAAKVNKEEITVHQINFVMQQQRGLKPEQADVASKQILERLIDQELAMQKAQELKLDRDPRVVQQLESARREIIARAYVERAGEAAPKPSPDEIKKYYNEKPNLFIDRHVYNIQELAIEAKPEQIAELRAQLQNVKSMGEFVEYLKTNNFKFAGNQAVRPAEQLPLTMVDTFAKMKDGQALLAPSATGAQVVVLVGSRLDSIDEARAKPAIEQFLTNEAKRRVVEGDVKELRAAAKIEYVGKFAEGTGAADAVVSAASDPPLTVVSPVTPAQTPASNGGLDSSAISKGMGLKK